ncbi:DNA-binding protein [Mycobacterium sp. SMC-16]
MDTLSMQDIADLADVARPVVTVWRGRYAQSGDPFPQPIADSDLIFDAAEVAEWFRNTGRGNNPHAADDAAVHSSLLDAAADRLDDASLLLLLHAKLGEPLAGLPAEAIFSEIITADHDALLPLKTAFALLDDEALVSQIDRLAEAGFSAARVLDRMVALARTQGGAEVLTKQGAHLLHTMLAELSRTTPGMVVPQRTGGLMLVNGAFSAFDETERPTLGVADHLLKTPWQRAAWRSLDARGANLRSITTDSDEVATSLIVGQWAAATPADAAAFFNWVADVAMELAPGGRAVIIGPATLLVDPLDGAAERHRFAALVRGDHYVAPLRYVARLPKGMCRGGGRRRLAMWVLAPAEPGAPQWTTYADHSDHALNAGEVDATAADVVAAVSGLVGKHSFLRSAARDTSTVLRRRQLRWPVCEPDVEVKGAALSRIWELASQSSARLIDDIDLAASVTDQLRAPLPWSSATTGTDRLAKVLKGVRLSPKDCHAAGAGTVAVIGTDEVRGYMPVGARRIDRLTLESTAPRARFTEPGDVVFVPTGAPHAIVDEVGGHVVQAPARIVRCMTRRHSRFRLLPEVLAADICAQRGTDTTSWTVRVIPADAGGALDLSLQRCAQHRAALTAELAALDALENELVNGLAAGTLTAHIKEPNEEGNAAWRR